MEEAQVLQLFKYVVKESEPTSAWHPLPGWHREALGAGRRLQRCGALAAAEDSTHYQAIAIL